MAEKEQAEVEYRQCTAKTSGKIGDLMGIMLLTFDFFGRLPLCVQKCYYPGLLMEREVKFGS